MNGKLKAMAGTPVTKTKNYFVHIKDLFEYCGPAFIYI